MNNIVKSVTWVLVGVIVGATAWPKLAALFKKPAEAAAAGAAAGRPGAPGGAAAPALRVRTLAVKGQPFAETITATGTLRAQESVELQVEVSGKIVAINFKEGSPVKKGDLLVKINDAELQATLARSIYRKQILDLKEKRLASLLKDGGVPQQDYDTAVNEVNVLKAEIDLINAQIDKTEVVAPFDGVVGLRFVSEGAFITATSNAPTRIATLQAVDNLKVDFSLPEKYAGRVKVGAPITFFIEGTSRKHTGEVYAIEPRVEVATRTILLRALSPNQDRQLLPGSFASVECSLATVPDAILLPAQAVIPGLTDKSVFVVVDGKAVRRSVQLGTRTESQVQIIDGLKFGEAVIVSNIQQLRAGLAVQAAEGSGGPGAGPGGGRPAAKPGGEKSAASEGKTEGAGKAEGKAYGKREGEVAPTGAKPALAKSGEEVKEPVATPVPVAVTK